MAMANADGGSLALGIEDDGTVTGVPFPEDRLEVLRRAPQTHVRPPLRARLRAGPLKGEQVWVHEVDWSAEVHQLTDGRYKLRVGDQNMPFPAADIQAIKEGKRRRVTEARFLSDATIADLDSGLIADLGERIGFRETPEELLLRYRLAERRNGTYALTLAAVLLFGKEPARWHPRVGIDFTRYQGLERRVGAEFNLVKRQRPESPLLRLIQEGYDAISAQIREPGPLVGLLFAEQLEYPTFAWQEALVNAVAHRDYGVDGLAIEVSMFDDRLEVRSPGELVEPVTLERLRRRERIHTSRNPRIVRVLTDFGYMREQGEGIPRMFDAMEREGLYPPELDLEADAIFTVRLKNTPVYRPDTLRWLAQFDSLGLSGDQKRLLAHAREHGDAFTNRAYRQLTHLDVYAAQRDIRDLIRKGLVQLPRKGGRVYQISTANRPPSEPPEQYVALEPTLRAKGYIRNEDVREVLPVSSSQANRIMRHLVDLGWLRSEGERRGRRYLPTI